MSRLDELPTSGVVKVLILGDSKSGKTGMLASLVKSGYWLGMLDFDNGARIIKNYLEPSELNQVDVQVCIDAMKHSGGRLFPADATAWMKALKMLDNWPGKGPVPSWTSKDILVVDSLTFAGKSAMNFHMKLNGKLAVPPEWKDFKPAQDYVSNFLSVLFSDEIKCNVVAITHIDYIAPPGSTREEREKQEIFRGYPSSIGSGLGPKTGRWFNNMLMVRSESGVRRIYTDSYQNVELGTEAPSKVKKSYPLSTGLADFFADVLGKAVTAGPVVSSPKLAIE